MGARDMLDAAHPADIAAQERAIARAGRALVAAERAVRSAEEHWNPLHIHESGMRLAAATKAWRDAMAALLAAVPQP